MQDKLKEDTVSADRKERIVFDPDAWKNSKKSGKKISSIASRQNFDNEKFTRKAKEVDESVMQNTGTSAIDNGAPTQSDTISKDKPKKSNNPQIEFVTGTAMPNGSSSTATGNAQSTGIKKISERLNLAKSKMGDVVKDFQKSDAPQFKGKSQAKRQQMAVAAKLQADRTNEETEMSTVKENKKTYTEFLDQLLEYTPGPGGVTRVKGRSYGAQYHDPEGDDDADDKPAAKPADAPKRGRGRPAGSKSGANQKVTSGKSYGGIATHSLNLPNSNR